MKDNPTAKLYYQVIKKYELPVRNHTHVKKKINEMVGEIGQAHACHYLQALLNRDLRFMSAEFKPVLAESLDIYTKRIKVEKYLKDNAAPTAWTVPTIQQLDAFEANRQAQWKD